MSDWNFLGRENRERREVCGFVVCGENRDPIGALACRHTPIGPTIARGVLRPDDVLSVAQKE